MKINEFQKTWPILTRQVKNLGLPWLDVSSEISQDPFKVLVSCILSLRTKDSTTAAASSRLFRIADTPFSLSKLSEKTISNAIYPVGFYRTKARRLREISRDIIEHYNGKVPKTIENLLTLKGVGRKTANLVITLGYRQNGICVDTHVHRITNRWGLVDTRTATATEFALRGLLPVKFWKELNGVLVGFGQNICRPISPICSKCRISSFCAKKGVTKSR